MGDGELQTDDWWIIVVAASSGRQGSKDGHVLTLLEIPNIKAARKH